MQDFNVRSMVYDGNPCKWDILPWLCYHSNQMLSFLFTDNSQRELSVYRKLSILVTMVTQNFKLRMILERKEWSWNEKYFYANFMKSVQIYKKIIEV